MTSHQSRPTAWWFLPISDFVAGTMGGFAGKLIEYPFDTVKVRLQTQTGVRGVVQNVRSHIRLLIEREGYAALYRGLPLPLLGTMIETACLFGTIGQVKKILYGVLPEYTMQQTACAGAITGLAVSFILTPIELVKCRMQYSQFSQFSQFGSLNPRIPYKGTWDCVVRTVQESGIRGLYRGHMATMMRESPGTAAWFGTYELIIKKLSQNGQPRSEINPLYIVLAGGVSGIAYNTAFYPADTVKTRIQTLPENIRPSIPTMFSEIFHQEGIRGLYRGISPTILRAIPANGAVFLSYELVSGFISRFKPIS